LITNPQWSIFATPAKTGGLYLSRHVGDENLDFSAMLTNFPAKLIPIDDILRLVIQDEAPAIPDDRPCESPHVPFAFE
jgi:hypothetical protein